MTTYRLNVYHLTAPDNWFYALFIDGEYDSSDEIDVNPDASPSEAISAWLAKDSPDGAPAAMDRYPWSLIGDVRIFTERDRDGTRLWCVEWSRP